MMHSGAAAEPRLAGSTSGLLLALRRVATIIAFAIVPIIVTVGSIYALVGHGFAIDFDGQFWPAGHRLLHGLSPYDLGWQDIQRDVAFPYGPIPALLFVPFGLLPVDVADGLFAGLCIAAVPLTLWLLGVRDWRIYGVVFLWQPVVSAWATANVTLLLGLGLALMWRNRDRAFVAGLLVALLVSMKLFLWPLAIWLIGTRRYAALGWAALTGVMLNLAAWAVVGFDQIGPYLKVLGLVSDREESRAYTVLAYALHLGASRPVAYALQFALAAAAGVGCLLLARRGREPQALLLCIAMSMLATPVTWAHYFALLIVPLALLRPRLSLPWLIPLAMVFCPGVNPDGWQLLLALAAVVALLAVALQETWPRRTAVAQAEAA
jgi:hypothetical protein